MTGPADYTGYALYREAMDAFGDPVFARWVCRGYPWGGVDLNRAREGFLLARDGVTMTGGDARTVLSLLVREVTDPGAPDRPRGAGGSPRAGRAGAAAADDRHQAAGQRAPRPCRVPAAVPLLGRRRRVLRGARRPPAAGRAAGRDHAAQRGEADRRRPEHAGRP